MAAPVPTGLVTHARKVCNLYKRWLRNIEAWEPNITEARFMMAQIRDKFHKNKNVRDLRLAKQLLEEGEKSLEDRLHPAQMYFPDSPGGCAYEREVIPPDWVLDYWHPTEKAMYPKYFALREQRKKEYIEFYNKQYPNAQKHFEDH